MATARRRRQPTPATTEQPDRVLTPEQKRGLTIDIMASWALDGMEPDRQTVENINAYLNGEFTTDEYLRKLQESRVAQSRIGRCHRN